MVNKKAVCYKCPVMYFIILVRSISVLSNPSMNDCFDLINIRLPKFSISACCSTVILTCGTCSIALYNLCLKISKPVVRINASIAPIHEFASKIS